MTGGEPLLQPEFLKEFFRLCRENGIHTALDTSGYICSGKALEVLEQVDLVLLDIKTIDAGHGNTTFSDKILIAQHFGKQRFRFQQIRRFTLYLPGIRIVAIQTTKRTSLHKNDKANSGTVNGPETL